MKFKKFAKDLFEVGIDVANDSDNTIVTVAYRIPTGEVYFVQGFEKHKSPVLLTEAEQQIIIKKLKEKYKCEVRSNITNKLKERIC